MDLKRLTRAEQLIGASALVLFLSTFLDWFTLDTPVRTYAQSGWDHFLWAIVPMLIGLVMLTQVAITRFSPDTALPDLPWDRVHLVGGIVAASLVVLKLLMGEDILGIDLDRGIGIYLGALAATGLGAGAYLRSKEPGGPA